MTRFSAFLLCNMIIVSLTLTACMHQEAQYNMQKSRHAQFDIYPVPENVGFSGNYLAGRFAQNHKDWSSAYDFMDEVRNYDPANNSLLQRSFLLALGNGDFNHSRDLAYKIIKENQSPEMATIFLAIDDIKHEQFASALSHLNYLSDDGFGHYTKPLLKAWALTGQGKDKEALAILEKNKFFDTAYTFHAGLIEDYSNNPDQASKLYQRALLQGLTVRESLIVANFFERQGDNETAHMIYTNIHAQEPENPYVDIAIARLKDKSGAPPPPALTAPKDGVALGLFNLTSMLYEKRAYESVAIYAQLVKHLSPDTYYIDIMLGDILAINEYRDQAIEKYASVPQSSELFWMAQLRIAEILEMQGRIDQAIHMVSRLKENNKYKTDVLVYMGDVYRRSEQYDKAVEAYNAALANVEELKAEHWSLVYARGMSLERINDWNNAEADLLKALEFQPNNPMVLNYLGYSWADQGLHLDKALDMIKKAVSLRPDDGYILDSYGWTLYRMEKFQQSVKWLEDAAAKIPNDFVINDHLGDAYWQVGRLQEARFQWERALNLAATDVERRQVRHKLQYGLKRPLNSENKEARLQHPSSQ